MAAYRLPAPLPVNEDVSESHLSYGLSGWVSDSIDPAHEGEISIAMSFQIFQMILTGGSLGNASQSFGTVMKLAVYVDVLKLIGEDAIHRVGIMFFQRLCP